MGIYLVLGVAMRVVPDAPEEGGLHVLAYNRRSGGFVRESSCMLKVMHSTEAEAVTERAFADPVERLRKTASRHE